MRTVKESPCCGAKLYASLADGVLVGSCADCGRIVIRLNPKNDQYEDLRFHDCNPWYDIPA